MAEPSIVINASEAMRVMENTIPRFDQSGDPLDKFNRMLGVLKLLMGDSTPDTSILDELVASVVSLKDSVRDLNTWRQLVMATLAEHEAAIAQVNTVSSQMGEYIAAVAARIAVLEETAATSGMSGAEETTAVASVVGLLPGLNQLSDSLKAMAVTPTDPVPVPPPDPIPPVEPTSRRR